MIEELGNRAYAAYCDALHDIDGRNFCPDLGAAPTRNGIVLAGVHAATRAVVLALGLDVAFGPHTGAGADCPACAAWDRIRRLDAEARATDRAGADAP